MTVLMFSRQCLNSPLQNFHKSKKRMAFILYMSCKEVGNMFCICQCAWFICLHTGISSSSADVNKAIWARFPVNILVTKIQGESLCKSLCACLHSVYNKALAEFNVKGVFFFTVEARSLLRDALLLSILLSETLSIPIFKYCTFQITPSSQKSSVLS